MKHRLLSAEQRVAEASQVAIDLAIDAIHDTAIQTALLKRNAALATADADRTELLSCIRDPHYPNRESYLIALLTVTTDPLIHDAVIYALVDIQSVAGGAAIAEMLGRGQIKNPLSSLYALNKLKTSLTIEQFITLVTDDALEVRYECLLLLEKGGIIYSGKPALKRGIDILQRLVRTGRNTDYLKQIIEVLAIATASFR